MPLLNERTWLFTMLFTTLTLDAILDLRSGNSTRAVWLLPAMFVLWANVHIQFVYGLFLLGLACVSPLIDRAVGLGRGASHSGQADTPDWWRLVGLTVACLAATLLTPYHVRIYVEIFEYASKSDTFNLVYELLAPAFRMPWDWAMPALIGAAAFALGRERDLSAFDVLLLAVTTFLALRARRDVWFAVLAALAVLATPRRTDVAPANLFALTRLRA